MSMTPTDSPLRPSTKENTTRVYEAMRKITTTTCVVRLWISISYLRGLEIEMRRANEVKRQAEDIVRHYLLLPGNEIFLAKEIADKVPGINAVEVLSHEGEGGLVYPDWP